MLTDVMKEASHGCHIFSFVGSWYHQCRQCSNAYLCASRGTLLLKQQMDRRPWTLCCNEANYWRQCIWHNRGREQNDVHSVYVRLSWRDNDTFIGGLALHVNHSESEEDTAHAVGIQIEVEVRRRLHLPHLPDTLVHFGVPAAVAYLISQSMVGTIQSTLVWKERLLHAVVTLAPASSWGEFRNAFLHDILDEWEESNHSPCCKVCLAVPDLATAMLYCRQCETGPLCSHCYDLDVDACVRCPEHYLPQGSHGTFLRMRRIWLG